MKVRKRSSRLVRQHVSSLMATDEGKMAQVEGKLGYKFKDKVWLLEALTHKSYLDSGRGVLPEEQPSEPTVRPDYDFSGESVSGGLLSIADVTVEVDKEPGEEECPPDDYERLEFLGDAVLNFLMAEFFFMSTADDARQKMPKQLHKMKTAVVNNTLLSLILIENRIHEHILYNDKALQFKSQIDRYVELVQGLLAEQGSTSESKQALDLDQLSEQSMKIFGDVFESLIGAVFIDSECLVTTKEVLLKLMEPYVEKYADLDSLQDHGRTKLLELWNQKSYMRGLRCRHEDHPVVPESTSSDHPPGVLFQAMVSDTCLFEMHFEHEAKSKVRTFYRYFYDTMSGFFKQIEASATDPCTLTQEELIGKIREYVRTTQQAVSK